MHKPYTRRQWILLLLSATAISSCSTFSTRIAPHEGGPATRAISFERPYFHRFVRSDSGRYVALRCDGDEVSPRSRIACYDSSNVPLWETVVAGELDGEGEFPELIGTAGTVRLLAGVESDSSSLDIYGRMFETVRGKEMGTRTVFCRTDATWDEDLEFSHVVSRDSSKILVYAFGRFIDADYTPTGTPGRTVFCAVIDSAFKHAMQRNVFIPYGETDKDILPTLTVTNGGLIHVTWIERSRKDTALSIQEIDPATGVEHSLRVAFPLLPEETLDEPSLLERDDRSTVVVTCVYGPTGYKQLASIRTLHFDWRSNTAAIINTFEITETREAEWNEGEKFKEYHCQAIDRTSGGELLVIVGVGGTARYANVKSVTTTTVTPAGRHSSTRSGGTSVANVGFGPMMILCLKNDGTLRSSSFIRRKWNFHESFLLDKAPFSYLVDGTSLRLVYGDKDDVVTRNVNLVDGSVTPVRPILSFGGWAWCTVGFTLWYGPDTFRLFCQQFTGSDWQVIGVRL